MDPDFQDVDDQSKLKQIESNLKDDDSNDLEQYRKIFGLRVKHGVTRGNVAALFFIEFINILVLDCEMSLKLNLLTNKDYYNLTLDQATDLVNLGERFTTVPNIVMRVLSGFIFDIYGRKLTIYWFILIAGFMLACTPLVAPS